MLMGIVAAICGGSALILAGGAALCAWSPRIKRELIGDVPVR